MDTCSILFGNNMTI